ncbi:hypothetical protein J2S49_001134 [Arcanobacterium wilhelmae]|uniref:DUF3427 domain-containing protein n=1 Tax=Arcanobacterium wilhelmae TaxID=1803177 RepID=A0ABT9NBH8_9ACTO|nr:DUF3427 domain-containing protein [Arcanobacterium wilhelmae]MDP9801058.1 hypothetical protein [Arcanobacterium wilhelmae]WFN90414.1 DUF3427 domain-containing protein [Arcanobacterium wilhelmae]
MIDFVGAYANNYLIPIALFGDNSRNKDSLREKLRTAHVSGSVATLSSISFDEIAKEQIFAALAAVKLDSMRELKADIRTLLNRLGRLPRLFDFLAGTSNPVLMAGKEGNYWALLKKMKFVEVGPTAQEEAILTFLSKELLPGKRPQELLVLRELLRADERVTIDTLTDAVSRFTALNWDDARASIAGSSVPRVLSLEFYTSVQQKTYGNEPVAILDDAGAQLGATFRELYHGSHAFRAHVDDLIETGLYLAKHVETGVGKPVVGKMYSRKDVCRLLGFFSNQEGVVNGYKTDPYSKTCPIFVTYHKDSEISASTRYGDEFISPELFHWFTRSRRTLQSKEIREVLSGEFELHLFVKKDDAEGKEFTYLGRVAPHNPVETTMPGDNDVPLPVVTIDMKLETPVEEHLYEYLNLYTGASKN